jgi:hypothetical protein
MNRSAVGAIASRVALVVVVFAGCGGSTDTSAPAASAPSGLSASPGITLPTYSSGPTATPEDPAQLYARIERQVEQIRGLTATAPVTPEVLDDAGLRARLLARFEKDNPPAQVAAEQQLYQALGLFPADASLRDDLLSLLTSQVIGFYEPDTKRMFVISQTGAIGPSQRVTFAHEYDHALQDQHFDLTKLGTDVADQGDRSLARLSLAEGDATLLMSQWSQAHLTLVETLQLLQDSADPAQNAILNAMPPLLRDELLLPYRSGLSFVASLWATGGWPSVDAAYARPPDSTEQLLHPEKYVAGEAPVQVDIPADVASRLGTGWKAALQDTLGEFVLREWLQVAGGMAETTASDAAAGWGGDRVVLVTGPSGRWGVGVVTTWDTTADADAFGTAAGTAAGKLIHADVFRPGETKVAVIVGSDDDIRGRLANVLGFAG